MDYAGKSEPAAGTDGRTPAGRQCPNRRRFRRVGEGKAMGFALGPHQGALPHMRQAKCARVRLTRHESARFGGWMQAAFPRLSDWVSGIGHMSSPLDLDAGARSHRAQVRKRGIRSAAGLLHLALPYGLGGSSLRGVASIATEARTAEALCCVALSPGDVMVNDRGNARVRNFAHARANGADFSHSDRLVFAQAVRCWRPELRSSRSVA